MLNNSLVALAFILSAMFEVSFLHALPYPYLVIPLHFIIGVIIMHRSDVLLGAMWFAASGLFLTWVGFDEAFWWTYPIVGAAGFFLTFKIFASRSVYALIGLGGSLYIIFSILNIVPILFSENGSPGEYFNSRLIASVFLIAGLYFGFIVARYLEYLASRVFLIRSKR